MKYSANLGQKVADNINDVEEFGALPPPLLERFGQILSKRRAINPRTLELFLQDDLDAVAIYDCSRKFVPTNFGNIGIDIF